jgi:hypothetical protein
MEKIKEKETTNSYSKLRSQLICSGVEELVPQRKLIRNANRPPEH